MRQLVVGFILGVLFVSLYTCNNTPLNYNKPKETKIIINPDSTMFKYLIIDTNGVINGYTETGFKLLNNEL